MDSDSHISPPVDDARQSELVERMQAGDETAFEQVVRQHGPRMLAAARRLLANEQDAQDALQDAFLSAFKSISQFKGQAQLGTWLHRIAVNAALMRLRSKGRKAETSIDDLLPRFKSDGHAVQATPAWTVALDTAVQDRETRRVVRQSIDQLPDNYRTVLLLRDIEGFTTEETAQSLGLSPSAVKTRLHRARSALRTLLDPYMREETAA